MRSRLPLLFLPALATILLTFPPAAAQYGPGSDDDGIRQSVARVSYFEGEVSFNRGDAPDDWQPASVNYPMTLGDRIWAGRDGRAELQLRGGTVFLGPGSELAALDLTRDASQLSLTVGTASFRINRLDRDEAFEVATPNVSVTFGAPGIYRIDVDEEGNSRVSVRQGRAYAAAAGGQVTLERGDQIRVRGIDRPDYDVVGLSRADSWDRWVDNRARRYRSVRSASYVHPEIYGAADLDAYGSWESAPEYGSVWYPRGMAAGWEPYRAGRWIWRDPWGWTWLSSEPWGWAPYHYGRWAVIRGRWGWVPVGPHAAYPGFAPAVVGFVGGGAGWSVSVSAGGFVGWFPLAPREPFDPWWVHARSTANVTSFNYAYRSRVVVVSRDVFVRGGRVDRDVVRDARIVHEVSTAPILRGPIPVLPTRESIRVSPAGVQVRADARPPQRLGTREVVTRMAPPPAPPTFDRKLEVIREKGGAPVTTDVGRRLSTEENRGQKAAQPFRPAGHDEVVLAPRGDVKESRKPQALPPSARSERAPAPEPRHEAEPVPTMAAPRRVEVPNAPPAREPVPPPQPEVRREPAPARPAPEARPERQQQPTRPPERFVDQPVPAPPARAERPPVPEARHEAEPPRPIVVPKRVDRPDTPPARERAPAPQPELRREPAPVQPVPQAVPERHDPGKAEPDQVDQRKKIDPGAAAPNATPAPKKGKKDRPDKEDEPGKKND